MTAGWNNVNSSGASLKYNNGSVSNLTVSFTGGQYFGTGFAFGGSQANQDAQLMNTFLQTWAGNVAVTLNNIPYSNYSIYAYLSSGTGSNQTSVSCGTTTYYYTTDTVDASGGFAGYLPISNTNSSSHPNGNYAVFSNLSGSSQTLTSYLSGFNGGFAGVEVVPSANIGLLAALPSTTPLQIGGGVFDLGGATQQVASLSDYSGGGGSIINSNTATTSILAISPTGTTSSFSGTILSGGSNGALSVVLNGNGGQFLTGNNTYTGATTITAGTLTIGGGGVLGGGNYSGAISNAGLLNYSSTANQTFSGPISGGGTLAQNGAGKLTLGGNNTFTSPISVNAGTLYLTGSAASTAIKVASGAALGGWGPAPAAAANVNSGGILDFTPNNTAGTSLTLSSLTFNGGATINLSDSGGQYNSLPALSVTTLATSSSPINVYVTNLPTGSGTLEIAHYSGSIGGSGFGAFNLVSPVSSGSNTYTLVNVGGYIELAYSSGTSGSPSGPFHWTGTGDGNWNATSAGDWATNIGGAATYQNGNDVLFDNRGSAGTTVNVNAANVTPASVTFSNSGAVSYSLTGSFGIAGSTSVTVNGGGLVTFNNNNTYTGPTTITAGTLAIGGAGVLGGGNYAGAVNNAGLLKYNSTANQTISGPISGGGSLAQNGPGAVALAGSNTYTGPTAINGGVLSLAAAENPGVAGPLGVGGTIGFGGGTLQYSASNQYDYSSRFSTAAGQNFRVDTNGQSATWAGSLTGNGGTLSKLGNGTLTVAGTSNSYSGPTIVAGGKLILATIAGGGSPSTTIGVKFKTGNYGSNYPVTGTAGAVPMANWNNVVSSGGAGSSAITTSTSASGGIINFSTTSFPGTKDIYGGSAPSQDAQLMNAYMYGFNGTTTTTLTGIPYSNYSIYVYFTGGSNLPISAGLGGTSYYFTTNEASGFTGYLQVTNTSSSSHPSGNYAIFSGLMGSSQTLTSLSNNSSNGLAAIEVVPTGGGGASVATLPSTTALQMGSGVFDLDGGSQQVASVSDYAGGGGSIISSNTSALSILTLSPTGTTTTYSGSILSGGTNGAVSLVLNGNGTQVLSGTNTYSGGTWVQAGTLIATNNEAIVDGSNLNVGSGLAAFGSAAPIAAAATPATMTTVPEPGTLGLFSIGAIAALAAAGRRRRYATP